MLLGLSDLLRTAVDGTGAKTAPLATEVALVTRYVDLQQLRFGDRLDVRYQVAPETESCEVPALLLQPLVENAFRHGIARQPGRCRLEIGSTLDGAVCCTSGCTTTGLVSRRDSGSTTRPARACATCACACSACIMAPPRWTSPVPTAAGRSRASVFPRGAKRTTHPTGGLMTTFQVLVVDDEPLARQVAVGLLRGDAGSGPIEECADGNEA